MVLLRKYSWPLTLRSLCLCRLGWMLPLLPIRNKLLEATQESVGQVESGGKGGRIEVLCRSAYHLDKVKEEKLIPSVGGLTMTLFVLYFMRSKKLRYFKK